MKLVTFHTPGTPERIGALFADGSSIAVLQAGSVAMDGEPSDFFASMLAFLQGGEAAREKGERVLEFITSQRPPDAITPVGGATLCAPVTRPESVRDCMAFEQHIINTIRAVGLKRFAFADEWIERVFGRRRSLAYLLNRAWYERPIYYKSNRFSVVGTGVPVTMPSYTGKFDYELEWGVFINRQGADIPRSKAREHIGGYTVFNDFSARDIQMRELGGRLGPSKGKDFDTGNAMGPCLVTPDEIPDPYALTMRARVNGEEWSLGSTSEMYWTFEDIIAYVSKSETLYPGEFIGSGTCSGSKGRGCGLEMGRFLKPGDVVELEVEGIGVLKNEVIRDGA